MSILDIIYISRWYFVFFIIGIVFLPLTFSIFNNFKDKGYIFAKTLGLIFITYVVFITSSLKIAKFSTYEILLVCIVFSFINMYLVRKHNIWKQLKQNWRLIVVEELIFIITFSFWTYIRGNNPDIHGLEKFMDFGFINSILRTDYFPAPDMWYSGFSINYYYFGHFVTAVIIKLSSIPSSIGYNLMLATLFGLTFTSVLSLGINLFDNKKFSLKSALTGIIAATLVTLGGNLTTIYTFFKPYQNENPFPFWNLVFSPLTFPNNYWYPNATRFIPFTIHEFPLYSFVVSDLHGHVLDIPFILLIISLIFSLFIVGKIKKINLIFISFLLAIMYMTNAWDGLIYFLLTLLLLIFVYFYNNGVWSFSKELAYKILSAIIILIVGFFLFSLPFSIHFKPFASGIGVICAPQFLTDIGKIGPFLFEIDHCQRSPVWQLIILYGFFYFFVISFILFLKFKKNYKTTQNDKFICFLIILSTFLIIVPEFVYLKDIYPMHYRANTMFKLVYESFIMLSIASGYIIVKIISNLKVKKYILLFFASTTILLYLVLSYPIFAINSFYDNLKLYKGVDGINYLKISYPKDYNLINWINKNIQGQGVILEASGDSYTDYARISANTGMQTIIGWSVHEWLWRGTYDNVSPRITDVQTLYTTNSVKEVKNLIKKYHISYVVISSLENTKYPNLNEENFKTLGSVIYNINSSKIYKINF